MKRPAVHFDKRHEERRRIRGAAIDELYRRLGTNDAVGLELGVSGCRVQQIRARYHRVLKADALHEERDQATARHDARILAEQPLVRAALETMAETPVLHRSELRWPLPDKAGMLHGL